MPISLLLAAVNPQSELAAASQRMQAGDWTGARPILENLIREVPQSAQAHNLLGVCLVQLKHPADSVAQFRAAVRLDPQYESGWLNLGSTLFALNDTREAVDAFDEAVRTNPRSVDGHLALAKIFMGKGDEVAAVRHLESIIQLDPHNVFALANAGLIESRRGNLDLAANYISRALDQNPQNIPLQLAMVELDLKRGKRTEAITSTDQIARNPQLSLAEKRTLAVLLLNNGLTTKGAELVAGDSDLGEQFWSVAMAKAKRDFLANKFQDVISTLDSIKGLRNPDADFHGLLGMACYEAGDVKRASDELQEAIKLDPLNADRYFQLGIVYLKHHTPDLAIIVFEHGLAQAPGSARLWLGLGLSRYLGDDTIRAQQNVQKALELDPRLVEGYVVLGDILESDGKLSVAGDVFRRAVEKDPKLYIGYYYCGKIAVEAGEAQAQQALTWLTKATELKPDFAEGHFERGRALEQLGKFQEAVAEYQTSLAKNSNLSQAHYRLAILYRKLGQLQNASNELDLFKKAKQMGKEGLVERLDYDIRQQPGG